jgi:hypothetical protein
MDIETTLLGITTGASDDILPGIIVGTTAVLQQG